MKNSERLDLLENLLRNVKIVLMENVMTSDFNRKFLEENPQMQTKLMPLLITIEGDIKQTVHYLEFIKNTIEELKTKPADEVYIIFDEKNKKPENLTPAK